MGFHLSRRALLQSGAASVLLAAPAIARGGGTSQAGVEAVDVLQAALELEQKTVVTHEHMNGHRMLPATEQTLCGKIMINHKRHAARLQYWIERLGSKPKAASFQARELTTRDEVLTVSLELEHTLMNAYLTHAGSLNGEMLADAVQILIEETKHHTLISSWMKSRGA